MWSLVSYECLRLFVHPGSTFLSIACTPGGVVTGSSDGIVRCWEVEEGLHRTHTQGAQKALAVTGSPTEVAAAMEHTLRKFVRLRTG